MAIKYRKVKRSELPQILNLVKGLAKYEKAEHEVTVTIDSYYENYDDGLINVIVAVHEHDIIGMALYYMTYSTWKGRMLYLEDLYVEQNYRKKGIGQALLDSFLAEAEYLNCALAKWQVLNWNTSAIDFYKKNGAVIEDDWYNCKVFLK